MSQRSQVVTINGVLSKRTAIPTGVPQGSILGPLLFLIYVNDLLASFSAELILFADDTTILANEMSHFLVSSDIQINLDKISSHSSKNRLAPHPGKTKVLLFSKRSQAICPEDRALLKLHGVQIDYVRSYKFLGFTLEEHLDYCDHMRDFCTKLNYGISMIRRVKVYFPLVNLANSLVLVHLHYCSPLFRNLSTKHLDTLLKLIFVSYFLLKKEPIASFSSYN